MVKRKILDLCEKVEEDLEAIDSLLRAELMENNNIKLAKDLSYLLGLWLALKTIHYKFKISISLMKENKL